MAADSKHSSLCRIWLSKLLKDKFCCLLHTHFLSQRTWDSICLTDKINSRYGPTGSRFQVPILSEYPLSRRQHCNCQISFLIWDFSALHNLILCPVRKAQGHNCVLPRLSRAFPNAWHSAAGCSTIANASHVCDSPNAGRSSLLCLNRPCVQSNSPSQVQELDPFRTVWVIWDVAFQNPYRCFVLTQISISFRGKFDLVVLE